jgi:hypothetical protein
MAGDLPVLSGGLVMPLRGNWTTTVALHSPTAPSPGTAASLVFVRESGAEDVFVGTVRRSGIAAGSVAASVTVVGGAGHLLAELVPRDHAPGVTTIPAGLVARGIADNAGEQLANGVEAALDGRAVRRWTRIAMPTRDALDLLADTLGWNWRVLQDGTIWVGPETWPSLDVIKYLSAVPDEAGVVYSCDGAPLRPGVTLTTPEGTRQVVEVVYSVQAGATRVNVRAAVPGDPPPTRASRELYLASYAATVASQDTDGTLQLTCDDPRLPDPRGVPFRLGIPGATATIPAGARVRLRFEGGDPRGVYACDLDQDATATEAFALVGDSCGYLSATCASTPGPVTFVISPVPTGSPGEVQIVLKGPGHKYAKGVHG